MTSSTQQGSREEACPLSFSWISTEPRPGYPQASYNRARYYDPIPGRFTSEDPINFGGGKNFYRYARNNAVNRSDPFGLNPAEIGLPWWWWILANPIPIPIVTVGPVGAAIIIGVGELTLAPSTGIDDARAIPKPKPKPCDRDKPDPDACKLLFLADVAHCNTAFQRGSPEHAACLATAATNYERCKGNMPGVREPLPGLPDK